MSTGRTNAAGRTNAGLTSSGPAGARATLDIVRGSREAFIDFLTRLCEIESPTDHPATQSDVHEVLRPAFEDLGFRVRIVPGRVSGNHFLAIPAGRVSHRPTQLLVGHSDTVWPLGTLGRMPVRLDDGRLYGPGTLDMKGGLTCIVFALRALRAQGLEPVVAPIVFVNSDEEVGSPDSRRHVRRLARAADRALIVEPALGDDGRIKTARKGVGNFEIRIRGRAAHAGLDPGSGASAIRELAEVIRQLDDLNDPDRGVTVNVGIVEGGTRPNVVAATASASVDVRVVSSEDGREIESKIRSLTARVPGVSLAIEGGMRIAPLERTPRNIRLWNTARDVGATLGLNLVDALAGGGSDGNTTSLYTATLDGLGCVGDGAHADHEHIVVDATLERCAILSRLLLAPIDDTSSTG